VYVLADYDYVNLILLGITRDGWYWCCILDAIHLVDCTVAYQCLAAGGPLYAVQNNGAEEKAFSKKTKARGSAPAASAAPPAASAAFLVHAVPTAD